MEGGDNSSNEVYRECQRNHAASLGSYATDGCGEFTPDYTTPGGHLSCAACGCHRNFHRKVTYGLASHRSQVAEIIDYSGGGAERQITTTTPYSPESSNNKKRFRTKFTEDQKEKMLGFAENLGWKLQRKDQEEDEIERFCRGIGISRKVFKVWMHNHKNSSTHSAGNASSLTDEQ
ncbi:hypothetical protein F511_35871 [Dorcoceras hygrometricum]|uniref:ZF-HD dimerization-type domain-containing protein n=1 Tax=Dorcoceras hygrometricum TaxID=472368 RepID=A0A2Z7BTD8_9LAMI|nr:hypothetical protein F511_35871 [Dorcoceras hygrometricum]